MSTILIVVAPVEKVWAAISTLDFKFWSLVKDVKSTGALAAGAERVVTFKDGTVQTFSIVEFSTLDHHVSYETIESSPAVTFTSALSTISVQRVTSDNTTFVSWKSEFSSDAGQEVIQDTQFKRKEGLIDLAKALQ